MLRQIDQVDRGRRRSGQRWALLLLLPPLALLTWLAMGIHVEIGRFGVMTGWDLVRRSPTGPLVQFQTYGPGCPVDFAEWAPLGGVSLTLGNARYHVSHMRRRNPS